DRKSTRLNSSHVKISYAVFGLKKKTQRRVMAVPRRGAFLRHAPELGTAAPSGAGPLLPQSDTGADGRIPSHHARTHAPRGASSRPGATSHRGGGPARLAGAWGGCDGVWPVSHAQAPPVRGPRRRVRALESRFSPSARGVRSFFSTATSTREIYTLSLHDALPI